MASFAPVKENKDTTRIGEYAAMQPVSGVAQIEETCAVNGHARGGFIRTQDPSKDKKHA